MKTSRPKRVSSENFARYGKVAHLPSEKPLAATPAFQYWSDSAALHIDGDTEIGYCKVFRQEPSLVNWVEKHNRTPEILIPIDAPFLLPVMTNDEVVEIFEVMPGEAVVINPGVWHSACHPLDTKEAMYFVIFRRGTPHQDVIKQDIDTVAVS